MWNTCLPLHTFPFFLDCSSISLLKAYICARTSRYWLATAVSFAIQVTNHITLHIRNWLLNFFFCLMSTLLRPKAESQKTKSTSWETLVLCEKTIPHKPRFISRKVWIMISVLLMLGTCFLEVIQGGKMVDITKVWTDEIYRYRYQVFERNVICIRRAITPTN